MEWYEAIDQVTPHVFRISTPDGSGSGWLVSRSQVDDLCVLATAAHVIDSAHYWEKPIRITHHQSGGTLLLRADQRAIIIDSAKDTAALIFNSGELHLPQNNPQLFQRDYHLKPGNEIGWLGYPAVQGADLCFFQGHVSAYLDRETSYLVDGVAINGVSGGPAFAKWGDDVEMIGLVSAYIPNRATGVVLPGVALIRDINQYHDYADRVRNLDDAQAQQSTPSEPPPPPETETQTRG
ncbi:trypsin-like peptidase domain-containing protein [Lysobacter brunescens]|uniref:Trypsin-like peptidase domain-containing protein n=1 Tax=Lysobacter brunescens TaxID=262323 RepID=A0ABW2Y741_9GAMM